MYFSMYGWASGDELTGPQGPPLVASVLIDMTKYQQCCGGCPISGSSAVVVRAAQLSSFGFASWAKYDDPAGQSSTPLVQVNATYS